MVCSLSLEATHRQLIGECCQSLFERTQPSRQQSSRWLMSVLCLQQHIELGPECLRVMNIDCNNFAPVFSERLMHCSSTYCCNLKPILLMCSKYAVRGLTYLSFSVIGVCHVHTSILFLGP